MNRRGFIGSILALGVAPALVRASSLMPVRSIVLPTLEDTLVVTGHLPGGITYAQITRDALDVLYGHMTFVAGVNRQFEKGDIVTIRRGSVSHVGR